MQQQVLFITGNGRSGTSLAERMAASHTAVSSASQPLPFLFVALARRYLQQNGYSNRQLEVPLTDQQFENYFDPENFTQFLSGYRLEEEFLQEILDSQKEFSGVGFKPKDSHHSLHSWDAETLDHFCTHYLGSHLALARKTASLLAFKEIVCEQFIPYFLSIGWKVLLVIRDPRDVVSSNLQGEGRKFIGAARPVLFMLRQWRKSVAYRLKFTGHAGFKSVRYEDIVKDPDGFHEDLSQWLVLEGTVAERPLSQEDGQPWQGNSSFGAIDGVSSASAGRYAKNLSSQMIQLIEAVCFADMKAAGYTPSLPQEQVLPSLTELQADEALERPSLAHYLLTHDRRDEEIARWEALTSSKDRFSPEVFLFPEAFRLLREGIAR